METAGAMLGEPYCIDLPVRHGKRLGTALGFPTINQIYPDWMLLPRQGVYEMCIRDSLKTKDFGRIAAQTAKHVIRQGLKEAERSQMYRCV